MFVENTLGLLSLVTPIWVLVVQNTFAACVGVLEYWQWIVSSQLSSLLKWYLW